MATLTPNIIDLGALPPGIVKLMIAQPMSVHTDWIIRDGLYCHREPAKVHKSIEHLLTIAKQHTVEVIVFPELSVPAEAIGSIQAWSKDTSGTAIAGSHYHSANGKYVARCPIIIAGNVNFTEKIIPAPIERSPVPGQGLSEGSVVTIFKHSSIGSFGVLICSDYLDSGMRHLILQHNLDFLFVPAFQKDSDAYHSRMSNDCAECDRGVYIVYSNMKCNGSGDGRSALFGIMDTLFFQKLTAAGLSNGEPPHKIYEFGLEDSFAIFDVDLENKRPTLPRTVHSKPNVNFVVVDQTDRSAITKFTEKIAHDDERYRNIEKYYVAPKELNAIRNRLEKSKLIFIVGDPGIGKTYTAAMLLRLYYDQGYEPIWFTGLEREERRVQRLTLENFEPRDRQIIYFEDPFGQLAFEKRESLYRIFSPLADRLRHIDARVIITSRKEIFEQFAKESLTSTELREFVEEMNVVKPSYAAESLITILRKLASTRCGWYADDKCRNVVESAIIAGDLTTPFAIRDLVYSTEGVTRVQQLRSAIARREKEEVVAFSREVISCDHGTKLLLALVYLFGYRGLAFLIMEFEILVKAGILEDSGAQHTSFANILRPQLGYRVEQYGKAHTCLRFAHPAYEQAVEEAGLQDSAMESIMIGILDSIYLSDFDSCVKALSRHSMGCSDIVTHLFGSVAELVISKGNKSQALYLANRLVTLYNITKNEEMRSIATSLIDPRVLADTIENETSILQFVMELRLAHNYDLFIGQSAMSMVGPLIDWDKVIGQIRSVPSVHQMLDLIEWIGKMAPDRAEQAINSISASKLVRQRRGLSTGDIGRAKKLLAGTRLYDKIVELEAMRSAGNTAWRDEMSKGGNIVPKEHAIVIDSHLARLLLRRSSSILPAGIIGVIGEFAEGDTISIRNSGHETIGVGIVEYNSHDIRDIAGQHSSQIAELIGKYYGPAVMRAKWWVLLNK